MYKFKKEYAGASISVGNPRLTITKENVNDEFVQKVISKTKSLHYAFEADKQEPKIKAVSNKAEDKHEA